jgi:hypothetical protein
MNNEIIEERAFLTIAKTGQHIRPPLSLFNEPLLQCPQQFDRGHWWRTIICVDDEDVVECAYCGEQRVTRCSFDDDYA